jgi:tetratricopeptide (TPR) repeat protein
MRFILLILLLSGLYGTDARCQPTAGKLDVSGTADTLPVLSLLARLDQLQPDTVKLKMLIELSRYYWHQGKGENLDTCLNLARAAEKLGNRLREASGAAEAVFMQAKVLAERNEMPQARELLPRVVGESRVRLLLVLAEQYINHKPVNTAYLDNALPYANHAMELSDSIRSDHWRHECLLLMGKYYFEKGDLEKGEKSILAVISFYHRSGDRPVEAHYWSELDLYMPKIDSTYPAHLRACRNAYEIYRQAGLQEDALFALRDWARMELEYEHLDTAERQFQTVLQLVRGPADARTDVVSGFSGHR